MMESACTSVTNVVVRTDMLDRYSIIRSLTKLECFAALFAKSVFIICWLSRITRGHTLMLKSKYFKKLFKLNLKIGLF